MMLINNYFHSLSLESTVIISLENTLFMRQRGHPLKAAFVKPITDVAISLPSS